MNFKKLLLATTIAAVSTTSFAMQSMDEEALSETAGQAGLKIDIDNANLASFSVLLHDTDGFAAATTRTFDGAIGINGIDVGQLDLTIEVDAGATAAAAADTALQIKVYNATNLVVNLGTLTVANSARDDATPAWGINGSATTVATLGTLTIGSTTSAAPLLNIQMGNEPQGTWMAFKPTFNGGLSIDNFAVYDSSTAVSAATAYGIGIGTLAMVNNGGTNLNADVKIDANASGLVLGITSLGASSSVGMDMRMTAVKLGNLGTTSPAVAIGDVEVIGLNLAGTTIAVIGH